MALTLSTANGYQVVTGVYEGQGTSAIRIGQLSQTFGGSNNPLVVGFTQLDDLSYTLQVFFDPSLSSFSQDREYNRIGFIQVSDFLINGLQTPFRLKDDTSPCLFTDQFNPQSHAPEFLKWVNVPKQFDTPPREVLLPEYPYWALQDNPQLNLSQLYKYPQLYGGYTNYNPADAIPRKGNDNLCAYMNLDASLSYEGLPVDFNNLTYFNTLDFSTLEGTTIPLDVPFDRDHILSYFTEIKKTVPRGAEINEIHTLSDEDYLLIEYMSHAKKGNRSIDSMTSIAVWNDGQTSYYAVLDHGLQEEWYRTERVYGRPDLNALNSELNSRYGYYINSLSLNGFRLSRRYDTYACATFYDDNTKLYNIKFFAGFRTLLSKQYDYDSDGIEGWRETEIHTESLFDTDVQQFIYTTQAFLDYQNPGSKLVRYL